MSKIVEPVLPMSLLKKYSIEFPRAWRDIEKMRGDRGKSLPFWPDWCYCPIAGAIAIITNGAPQMGPAELARLVEYPPAVMAALAAWRITKGVYRFDETLLQEIAAMPLEGNLPANIFFMIPEWCIYIETPGFSFQHLGEVEGFFTHLEYDPKDGRRELRILFVTPDLKYQPIPLHLGDWSLQEAVSRAVSEGQKRHRELQDIAGVDFRELPDDYAEKFSAELVKFVNLILYICSENADFGAERPQHPSNSRRRTKKGKLVAANEVRAWDIGVRLGSALRKARQEGPSQTVSDLSKTHASPRPHYRRAHWHHFWTGPKSKPEERKLILRWLPPIPVGIAEFDDIPVVIKPVKKE